MINPRHSHIGTMNCYRPRRSNCCAPRRRPKSYCSPPYPVYTPPPVLVVGPSGNVHWVNPHIQNIDGSSIVVPEPHSPGCKPGPRPCCGPQPRPCCGPAPSGPCCKPRPCCGPQPRPCCGPEPRPCCGPGPRPCCGPGPRPCCGPGPRPCCGPQPYGPACKPLSYYGGRPYGPWGAWGPPSLRHRPPPPLLPW